MKIQKAKMPLKDGARYYLPLIFEGSMEPLAEGGGCFSTPGARCLMLSPKSVRELREETDKRAILFTIEQLHEIDNALTHALQHGLYGSPEQQCTMHEALQKVRKNMNITSKDE